MKKLVLFVFMIGLFVNSAHSQNGKLEFNQKKISGNGFAVYFEVVGIIDEAHALTILDDLIKDNNIEEGRYFISSAGKDRYQLYINENVSAEYVREIILSHNVDFDFSTISIDGIRQIDNSNIDTKTASPKIHIASKGFPRYEKSDDKLKDDINYSNAKEQWIQENPEEYNRLLKELEEKQ